MDAQGITHFARRKRKVLPIQPSTFIFLYLYIFVPVHICIYSFTVNAVKTLGKTLESRITAFQIQGEGQSPPEDDHASKL